MENWLQQFFSWLPEGGIYYLLIGLVAWLESLVGIGLKMALYLCALAAITLLTMWLILTVTQRVMFNHEMTDLADETKLRGAQLEDLTQVLLKDFQILARTIEERNEDSARSTCEKLADSYLLVEIFDFHPDQPQEGHWRYGNARELDSNPSSHRILLPET